MVERRITLDWVLGRYSRQPVEKLSPAVRDILRMAVYQLLYIPSIPERAAVNEAGEGNPRDAWFPPPAGM